MNLKEQITKHKIEEWLGTDKQLVEAIEVIYEIAVGEYSVEALRKDIIDYYNGNWKYMEDNK